MTKCSICTKEGHNKATCLLRPKKTLLSAPPPAPPAAPTPPAAPKEESKQVIYLKKEIAWRKEALERVKKSADEGMSLSIEKIQKDFEVEKAILDTQYKKQLADLEKRRGDLIASRKERQSDVIDIKVNRLLEVIDKYETQLKALQEA
jgi:hypothetical protein